PPSSTPPRSGHRTPRPPIPAPRSRPPAAVGAVPRTSPPRPRRWRAARHGPAVHLGQCRSPHGPGSCSSQGLLVDPVRPLGEWFTGLAVGEPTPHHPFDVVGQVGRRHLQLANRPTQPGLVTVVRGEPTSQVHLESGLVATQQLTLQTDVGGLHPGARVLATV